MPRHTSSIALLALPGVQLLDVAGPLDVFAEANVQAGRPVYTPCVVGLHSGPITSSSGVRLLPDYTLATAPESFDTLLVAGAPHLSAALINPALLQWLRTHAPRTRRYGSVCSGALVLAAAGLLAGRRVTTHWSVADDLQRRFPDVTVEIDALHVRDGEIRTAAGVTAGLDLAVALVEGGSGRDLAKRVAAHSSCSSSARRPAAVQPARGRQP